MYKRQVFQCAVTLGILAVYGLGLVVRWRALAIIGAAPPLLLLLAARALVPETPRWLLLVKGDLPGARRAMVHLRAGADDESVDDELEDLARAQPADVDDDDAVRARNYAPPSLSEADCCGRGAAHDERPNPRATGAAAHAERSGVLSDEAMSAAVAVAERNLALSPVRLTLRSRSSSRRRAQGLMWVRRRRRTATLRRTPASTTPWRGGRRQPPSRAHHPAPHRA